MLYNFKFTIVNHDGSIYREDIITAGTAADADFLYTQNVHNYIDYSEYREIIDGKTISKRTVIECIEEVPPQRVMATHHIIDVQARATDSGFQPRTTVRNRG